MTEPDNIFHALYQNNLTRQNSSSDTNNPNVESNQELAAIRSDETVLDPPVARTALESESLSDQGILSCFLASEPRTFQEYESYHMIYVLHLNFPVTRLSPSRTFIHFS